MGPQQHRRLSTTLARVLLSARPCRVSKPGSLQQAAPGSINHLSHTPAPPSLPPALLLLCHQAQERGELVKLQDDASYAMDGLSATCRLDTQQDSAVTLTEMLSTRKGRVALR